MKTIDVEGLPEPIVRAMETVVHTLREQLHGQDKPRVRVELPVWPGEVVGHLTRAEIYEDAR